jgi:hypothetical protein
VSRRTTDRSTFRGIYMESGTVRAVLPKLRYWLGPGQTAVDAAELQEPV